MIYNTINKLLSSMRMSVEKAIVVITMLLLGFSSYSFPKDTLNRTEYNNFVHMKELWVCSSRAVSLDISTSVFGVAHLPSTGYYVQVPTPGIHKDGSVAVKGTWPVFAGVFNITGRAAGVYEFVYVSTSDDFCGMGMNDQSIVRVYLVPELKDISLLANICPSQNFDIDLTNYLPYDLKNFVDSAGWIFKFSSVAKASMSTVGSRAYTYKIDDTSGPFKGKFNSMQSNNKCSDTSVATVNVKIREDKIIIPPQSISFCLENLMSTDDNKSYFTFNAASILGVTAEGGVWTSHVLNDAGIPVSPELSKTYVEMIDADNGVGGIKINAIVGTLQKIPFSLRFIYNYKNCDGSDASTHVDVILTDDIKVKIQNAARTVCRNYGSGVLNLESFFGFSVPQTSGIWMDIQKKNSGGKSEMLIPEVNLMDLNVGSEYKYQYMVNPSSVNLCNAGIKDQTLTLADYSLRVKDAEVLSSEAKICKKNFETGTIINLLDYVAGLDTAQVTWSINGNAIPNPRIYEIKSNGAAPDTTLIFNFEYMAGECGLSTGKLYVSTIDSTETDINKTVQVCYTDDYAKNINLFQVLGIIGTEGSFKLKSTVPESIFNKFPNGTFNEATGKFNASQSFDPSANNVERYVFEYKPAGNDKACITGNASVTVIVTKDVSN